MINETTKNESSMSQAHNLIEKMEKENIILTDENIKEYEFFITTKEINLEDGTHIKKGTEFREEGFKDNKYTLHFCQESENKYTNETAEYEFLLSELKAFSLPIQLKQQFQHEQEVKATVEDQYSEENKIFTTTEVNKIDHAKGTVHIYQLNDNPDKCFIGKKEDNKIKQLGSVAAIETVKKEFKEFKEFEKEHSKTSSKDKIKTEELSI